MAAIFQVQGHIPGQGAPYYNLHAMSLPSFVGITRIDLEKTATMWFSRLKMVAI